jgi:hypothetical protein
MREKKNVYKVLVEKPKGKIPLARSRLRWKPTIKVALGTHWLGWHGLHTSETCIRLLLKL